MCAVRNLLIFSLLMIACESKLYEGKCPKVQSNVSIECGDLTLHQIDNLLRVVGHISMPSTTLNFFHNPFISMNCMRFHVTCGNDIDHVLRFMISCNFNDKHHFCFPIRMLQANEDNGYNSLEFDFLPGSQCEKSIIKNEILILYNDAFKHMILYGCWEVDEQHSEYGVWILASKERGAGVVNVDEFKNQAGTVLNTINKELVDDIIFYTNDTSACRCQSCKYFMDCDITKGASGVSRNIHNKIFSCIMLIRILYQIVLASQV